MPGPAPLERWLIALAALSAWSITPPYLGPLLDLELEVAASVEVVDHVLPGVSALIAALIALRLARRGEGDSLLALSALAVCALAGLFEAVTHVTLVLDAGGPQQPVGAVVLHASPGPAILIVSLWLLLRPQPSGP